MRIVTKIWIGFALLIAGYVMTISMTEVNSRRNERFLRAIESSAFPCANAAQGAITVFKQLLAAFQDAVVFGEVAGLERTQSLHQELFAHLQLVSADPLVAPIRQGEALRLEHELRDFMRAGVPLYSRLARSEQTSDLLPRAAALKSRSEQLMQELEGLRDDLRRDLREAVDARSRQLRQTRMISEAVFASVLLGAVALVATVILNLSQRLHLLIGASARLTAGDYLSAIGERTTTDEVGQLGQGFEAMRTAIHARNQELQAFNARLDGLVRERTHELEQRNGELSTQITERQRAEHSLRLVEAAIGQIDEGVAIVRADERPASAPEYLNPGFYQTLRLVAGNPLDGGLLALFGDGPVPGPFLAAWTAARSGTSQAMEIALMRGDGVAGEFEWQFAPLRDGTGRVTSVVSILRDLTDRKREEAQRQQGQKMESIGQLAAGVAHEINTPIQFIGDNLRFLGDSFADLADVLSAHGRLLATVRAGAPVGESVSACEAAAKRADVDYITEEIPKAIGQSLEGVTRVAEIVRAMKEFSHPDQGDKRPTDLNKAITTTLIVARNEYKYVADLVTDLADDLPAVPCLIGEFNQVILNLVVNAAHAIGDVVATSGGKGTITVSTRLDDGHVEVRIGDTGTGIPSAVRGRIFDPFFTTKEVGKGTGQGLYIAQTVVAKKHGGTLSFLTEPGKGTTFIMRLPLESRSVG